MGDEGLSETFPEGFLWGAAAAAHQVEGGNRKSDWWQFELQGGTPERSGDACDHYTLYGLDFDVAKALGHNAHRLSIEWSRIQTSPGPDGFDPDALEHYRRVLLSLRERGIASVVTLHHVTNPTWFAAEGGWASAEAPAVFELYVSRVAETLGDLVDYWITVSEPTSHTFLGHAIGYWPPLRKNPLRALRVLSNFAEGHKRAYAAIHSIVGDRAMVGASTIHMWWRPVNRRSRWQKFVASRLERLSNYHFSDKIRDCQDFYGLNYYFTFRVPTFGIPSAQRGVPVSDLGWPLVPEGLAEVARRSFARYGKPILVTEHGLADEDDEYRWWYIRESLRHLRHAIGDGVDVRGYLHWSLTDNFEWRYGFWPRFGLVAVDYETQDRTIRESARRFAEVCHANSLLPRHPSAGALKSKSSESPNTTVALAEYEALRREIDKADQWLLQLIFYAPWAAALMLWTGITRGSLFITLGPLVLLAASALGILSRVEHEMRLAAYIRERLERRIPELGLETFLIRAEGFGGGADSHLSWATLLLYGGLAIACLWKGWTMAATSGQMALVIAAGIGALALTGVGVSTVMGLDRRGMTGPYAEALRDRRGCGDATGSSD